MAKVIKGVFPNTLKQEKSSEKKIAPEYVLKVSIMFSDPLIWRRIQVPGDFTLAGLHDVIQAAMGWSDSHMHQFLVGKISYEPTMKNDHPVRESKRFDECHYKLQSLEEGMTFMFTYFYDAGEGWEHEIMLEETLPGSKERRPAQLLDGAMACPPEEVGDIHEYIQLVSDFEDPDAKDRRKLLELSGNPYFDPADFDIEEARKRLQP